MYGATPAGQGVRVTVAGVAAVRDTPGVWYQS